jgi:hypothetical protein
MEIRSRSHSKLLSHYMPPNIIDFHTILYIKYLVRLSVRPWRSSGPSQTDDRARPDKTGSRSCPAALLRGEDPVFPGPGPGTPGVRCVRAPVEVLKPRSWEPNIEVLKPEILKPSVRLSRSWNSGPESQMRQHGSNRRREPRPSVWVLKPSCRGS